MIRGNYEMEKIKWMLYIGALLLIGIPMLFVFTESVTFSSFVRHMLIGSSIGLLIAGLVINAHQKRKANKSFTVDIGIAIGLLLVLVFRLAG